MTRYLPKLLITGANGQLANALRHHTRTQDYEIYAYARSQLDITNKASIESAISQIKPDYIINTAAYTAVDKAEEEKEQALKINYEGSKNLALLCEQNKIPLIHLSTDYVFDGNKKLPYLEEDGTHPLNHYGESKWLGENAIREHTERHLIVRVSGIFSEYGHNFLKTILHLAKEKNELRVVSDQWSCPTSAHDIAAILFDLMKQDAQGTYHFCSDEAISWHQFASTAVSEAKRYQSLTVNAIHAISTAEYKTAAQRPLYSVLDCSKIKRDFAIMQPSWKLSLKKIVAHLFLKEKE